MPKDATKFFKKNRFQYEDSPVYSLLEEVIGKSCLKLSELIDDSERESPKKKKRILGQQAESNKDTISLDPLLKMNEPPDSENDDDRIRPS